jgi:uncharacterized protein YndB with AHSA1/START domain
MLEFGLSGRGSVLPPGSREEKDVARLEVSREIGAPVDAVYSFFDDHDNYAQFFHGYTNFQYTTRVHEVGTRLKMEGKTAGVTVPMELETTDVEPSRRVAGTYLEGLKGTWEWLLEPTGSGTKVTMVTDYELPLGLFGQIADKAIVERQARENIEASLHALQRVMEQRAAK